jgi:dihydroorotase
MPQLLLKGGRVIDPASSFDAVSDVLVDGASITAIGPDLAHIAPHAEIIDCGGRLVLPGLIDTLIQRNSVDFPQPDGPSRQTVSP